IRGGLPTIAARGLGLRDHLREVAPLHVAQHNREIASAPILATLRSRLADGPKGRDVFAAVMLWVVGVLIAGHRTPHVLLSRFAMCTLVYHALARSGRTVRISPK